jgi:hypothetical protein
VLIQALEEGRIRPSLDASSVLVRLMCSSRAGQLEVPAWACRLEGLRVHQYVVSHLGMKHLEEMRKLTGNKAYSAVSRGNGCLWRTSREQAAL